MVSADDAVSNSKGFSSIVGLDPIVPLLRRCAIWPFQPEKAKAMTRFDSFELLFGSSISCGGMELNG